MGVMPCAEKQPRVPTLSVVMPTKDCVALLRAVLPALDFADEIVVVDMFSTDGSAELVRETPRARLIQRHGYIEENVNAGIDASAGDWIYLCDSDEIPTPALRAEVRQAIESAPPDLAGFLIPNAVYWCGEMLRYGPQYDPHARVPGERYRKRLFRRGAARYAAETYHEDLVTDGTWGRLTHRYDHYTISTMARWFEKANLYTTGDAERADVARLSANRIAFAMLWRPLRTFLVWFVKKRGFRDGALGVVTCGCYAASDFMLQVKLWEKYVRARRNG